MPLESGAYDLQSGEDTVNAISGTEAREKLGRGERLPAWYMRDAVQDMLLAEVGRKRPIFCP